MKRIALAAALMIATGAVVVAQTPATGDPHHPPQTATPAPQATPPQAESGRVPSHQPAHGMMPGMMKMMQGMMHQQTPAGSMQQGQRSPQPHCPMMAGNSDGMMQGMQGMMQMMMGMMQMMHAQMHSGQSQHGSH